MQKDELTSELASANFAQDKKRVEASQASRVESSRGESSRGESRRVEASRGEKKRFL